MNIMKPTDTELILLKCLWQDKRLSARELHDRTYGHTGWSYSSTRKTLDRMVEKGLLQIETVHGLKTFVTGQGKLETLAGLIHSFSQNILGSDTPLPATAFTGSKLLDADEIRELERMLETLETDGASDDQSV